MSAMTSSWRGAGRQADARHDGSETDSDSDSYDVLHLSEHAVGHSSHDGLSKSVSKNEAARMKIVSELTLPMYEADVERRGEARSVERQTIWKGIDADGSEVEVSTDRFDAIHLLDKIPTRAKDAPSPFVNDGMSDLDSDTEDVFFLNEDEVATYRQEKRQRYLADLRQKRLDALEAEEAAVQAAREDKETTQAASSEAVLTEEQFNLMKRTAAALRNAGNASALTMRILANHGNDVRFAFLRRGKEQRWADVWTRLLAGEDLSFPVQARIASPPPARTSLLAPDYDTDSDEDDDESREDSQAAKTGETEAVVQAPEEDAESRRKRKLALAHEWARKRREAAQCITEEMATDRKDVPS